MGMKLTTTLAVLMVTAMGVACSSPTGPTLPPEMGTTNSPLPEAAPAPSPAPQPPDTLPARYRATFDSTWSAVSHPIEFPATAHFSPLIGGTHNGEIVFWREGELASQGIKDMAERGQTSPLEQEINTAIRGGAAEFVIGGRPLDVTPGTVSVEFTITPGFPLVTLVTMIAPSPDWFVGVNGLSLMQNGRWVAERRVELVPWDAGTDSAPSFIHRDTVTNPFQPISRIVTAPLSPNGVVTPLGTFTFTRIQ